MITVDGLVIADASGRAVVDGVSFTVEARTNLGIVGESGSGKTTTGLALLGMVRPGLHVVGGSVQLDGVDVLALPKARRRDLRRRHFAYLGQDPASSLTPTMRIGRLLAELAASKPTTAALLARLAAVGLPADSEFLRRYPHELSGGQRQRVALAAALTNDPDYLVLDEPTTGLDTVTQRMVLDELAAACRQRDFATIVVSHDLGVIARFADHLLVLRGGEIVDRGSCVEVLSHPMHPYSRELVAAASAARDPRKGVNADVEVVLRIDQLHASHRRGTKVDHVVDDVNLAVTAGECVAVVGPSGSGKTTVARCIVGLHAPDSGTITVDGSVVPAHVRKRTLEQRRRIQLVPQDPGGSLNPRRRVGATIVRSLVRLGNVTDRAVWRDRTAELLELVHLDPSVADRYPRDLSGGERQRVAIARALAADPTVLVCDEITSALDVSVQAGVLALLAELQERLGLAIVFITHDLHVVSRIADRVVVLDGGSVCEVGVTADVLGSPSTPRTRALLDAAMTLDGELAARGVGRPR